MIKSSQPPPSQYDSVVPTPRTPTWRSAPDPLPRLIPPVSPTVQYMQRRRSRHIRAAVGLSGILTVLFMPFFVTAYTLVHFILKYW